MGQRSTFDHPLQIRLQQTGKQLLDLFQPAAPFILQATASMGAYTAGLATTQAIGSILRISCSTPILGPISGFLGVGLASACAGQAAIACRRLQREGLPRDPISLLSSPTENLLRDVRPEDLLVDAVLGIAAFSLMGGKFRSIMPSDITRVGAIARESMPASGMQYAGDEKRTELIRMFRRDGCHHCGTRRGPVIGDHMPPNKQVQDHLRSRSSMLLGKAARIPLVKRFVEGLGVPVGPPRQRYFPQCVSCCQMQAGAVRANRSRLVFHEVLHRGGKSTSWHYAGTLVGLRHSDDRRRNNSSLW